MLKRNEIYPKEVSLTNLNSHFISIDSFEIDLKMNNRCLSWTRK